MSTMSMTPDTQIVDDIEVKLPLKRRSEEDSSIRPSLLPLGGEEASGANLYGASHFGQFGEYMRRKRAKLQIQNTALAQVESNNGVFDGLSIHVNGWTEPSVQDLRRLIVQNGGIFQPYLDRKSLVTHVVTCSLTPAKLREFKNMKVVLPVWIVESVSQGRLLPWQDYRYLHEKTAQGQHIGQENLLSFTTKSKPQKIETNRSPSIPADSNSAGALAVNNAGLPSERAETNVFAPYAADPSNLNAQKALADPEWRRAQTSAAPDFVEGYYRNSRLHYLSTWKAELRALIAEAHERLESAPQAASIESDSRHTAGIDGLPPKSGVSMHNPEIGQMRSPPRNANHAETSTSKTMPLDSSKSIREQGDDSRRVIMHCDFDCFFVSVGLTTRPHLRGKPVVVSHSQGTQGGMSSTSEVASASYEAREKGVRNGMSLQQARKLCPNILTMPYEFERYRQLSLQFYGILLQHADDIQAVSVDEALIEVTSAVKELSHKHSTSAPLQLSSHDVAKELAESIRDQVRQATGCEISIGIAHNILLARLATRHAKPAGSFHLSPFTKTPDEILEFLSPLDISDLPGFGSAAKSKALEKLGSSNIAKLREFSKSDLCTVFGPANGATLWGFVRGVDNRQLERDGGRRSVSCDINYGIRFADDDEAERFIYQMAKEVKRRLDDVGMRGSLLTLKVLKRSPSAPIEPPKFLGCGKCGSFTKQTWLLGPSGQATNDDKAIAQHAWRLLGSFRFDPRELRGIGIQIQRLEPNAKGGETKPIGGQTLLAFKPMTSNQRQKVKQQAVTTNNQHETECESTVVPSETSVCSEGKQIVPQSQSLSQTNFNVYNELPVDIKKELDEELKGQLQSPVANSSERASVNDAAKQGHGNKRITQQLAPRTAWPDLSPQKSNPFLISKRKSTTLHISESELHSLGIDPAIFSDLPEEVQQEQLVQAKFFQKSGKLSGPTKEKSVLKPRKPSVAPGELRTHLSPPRAKFREQQLLRQRARLGEKLYLTDAQSIQNAMTDWIERHRHWGPKKKDVEFFSKHLLQCVDGSVMGDDGIEKASTVMKWWLVLLRRFWGAQETMDDLAETGSDQVGKDWWQVFRDVKQRIDAEVRRNFGGSISLK